MLDIDQHFPNEESCMEYLERTRWNGFPVSPFEPLSKVYTCRNGNYRCRNTGKYFNVKTGTMFYNSKIPLRTWFLAILLLSDQGSEWNSVSLSKKLGLTQKTTWLLMQKIKRHLQIGLKRKKKINYPVSLSNDSSVADIFGLSDWLKSLR